MIELFDFDDLTHIALNERADIGASPRISTSRLRTPEHFRVASGQNQAHEIGSYHRLGGFDEAYINGCEDVDLCLRAQSDTIYVLYTPDVQLIHHVSSSRGSLDPLEDRNRFIRRWDIFGTFKDPFFPEALLLLGETMYYLPR